jgi:hypothetical protein
MVVVCLLTHFIQTTGGRRVKSLHPIWKARWDNMTKDYQMIFVEMGHS